MLKLKSAIMGSALVLLGGAAAAVAQSEQRNIEGDFFIGGESCGKMVWYWPDKNYPEAGFSWEIEDCDQLNALMDGTTPPTPSSPEPTPEPTPTPIIDQGECPSGAQWLTQNLAENVVGFDSIIFEPNETKYFCLRLPESGGNAFKLLLHVSGLYNDHGCEQMVLEATVPAESTVNPAQLQSIRSRAPDLRIAAGFNWQDPNLAPPGLYVLKATEAKGVRQPGEKVCRNYRVYAVVQY
jgi:hypothetical protein